MAADNFNACLARVLVYEGGKVDDPRDPGGRTAYGVTQRTFTMWLQSAGRATRDVFTITKDEIAAIYRAVFWDRIHGDELPAGIDFACFDAAVNSGVGQAAKWVQRALGQDYSGRVDGSFGPATVLGCQKAVDHDLLVGGIDARRLATLKTLKTWKTYGKGWSARIANVTKIGQAWAMGSVGPDPVSVVALDGHRKADVADVRRPFVSIPAGTTVAGAAGAAGTALPQLANAVDPLKPYVPWLAALCVGLVAVGAVLVLVANWTKQAGLKAQDGVSEEPDLDLSADDAAIPVPVNDNAPLANVEAA